jgi:hypothetical protein
MEKETKEQSPKKEISQLWKHGIRALLLIGFTVFFLVLVNDPIGWIITAILGILGIIEGWIFTTKLFDHIHHKP